MQTPTGTLRVDVKRIALTRNQLPINRFGTGQSISRIRCIKGLEELLGDDAPQVFYTKQFGIHILFLITTYHSISGGHSVTRLHSRRY